jgi:hypothetical protein
MMPKRVDTVTYIVPGTNPPEYATKQIEVEYRDFPVKDVVVKVSPNESVSVQLGPTPGEAFAVFAKNAQYHDAGVETWTRIATTALELWAAKGNHTVTRIIGEHGRPLNLKLEYAA